MKQHPSQPMAPQSRKAVMAVIILVAMAAMTLTRPWLGFVGIWRADQAAKLGRNPGRLPRSASLTWNWSDKLGEGSFKEAYMAKVTGEGDYYGYEVGKNLVLKFMKPKQYKKGFRITSADVAAQELAQAYAKKFVKEHRPNRGGQPLHVFFRIGKLVNL